MSEVKRQGDVSVGADLPSAEDMMNWAFQAVHKREWNKAVDRWALLRKSYPELPVAWVHGSIAHRSLGQYVQAEKLITEAFVRFPKNVNVFVHRIELELERGNLASAEDFSDQAKDLFPSDTNVLWSVVNVHAKKGDIGRAELENCQAREQFPEDSKLTVQFAELAMQQECWGTALERWSEVRELFPDERSGYTRAADAALALGNEPLSRQLRLAQEYGNTWLKGLRSSDEGGGPRPAVSPPQKRSWKGFVALVWTKAQLNLKSEASQNHLRYLWWILDPVLYMAVFYIVFGLMMNRGGPGFIAYLLTGLVPFQWFAKTIGQASGSIVAGKGLMHQVNIPPMFFPLVGIVQNSGKQSVVFLTLGVFLTFYGLPPTIHWLAIFPVVFVHLILMLVVSCFLAMLVPFIRDIANIVPTGIQFLMFTSGVFFTVDHIPEEWRSLFFLNPVATLLHQYRLVLVENQWPDWIGLSWVFFGASIGLVMVVFIYRRLAPVFPRVVIE